MKRNFETIKSDKKLEALSRWKQRQKITQIAEDLRVARDTIYRWVKDSENRLGKRAPRRKKQIDSQTRFRIIELYMLLRKPSLAVLSKKLEFFYHLRFSPAQLKYWLSQWDVHSISPTPFFDEIISSEAKP